MNKAIHKLAGTRAQEFYAMPEFEEVVLGSSLRSGNDKFEGLCCHANIIKTPNSPYLVNVMYQYALGERQIVATRWKFKSLKSAIKFMNNAVRFYYGRAVSRKIAFILSDGILPEDTEEIMF